MGNLGKIGIGCGVVVVAGIVAIAVFAPKVWNKIKQEGEAIMESIELAGGFVPPKDDNWIEKDWPDSLVGGWTLVPADTQLVKVVSLADENWTSRMYKIQPEEGEQEPFTMTVHLRPVGDASLDTIKEDLKNFELPNQTSQTTVDLGSRISRELSNGDKSWVIELWTLGQEQNWLMMVEGSDGALAKNGAVAFLESLKPEAGYVRR